MKKRHFGIRAIPVVTRRIRVADIARDTRFQTRLADNAYVRGADIARAVKADGATAFRDNMVVVEIDGVIYPVDCFGRQEAATILRWESVDADFISGRNPEKTAWYVALTANNKQVSQRGFSGPEHAVNAYRLYTEQGVSYDEIAEAQGCTRETARRRVMKGKTALERHVRANDLSRLSPFVNGSAAQTAALTAMKTVLRLSCSKYADLLDILQEKYNVNLRVLAGDNEKQVAQVALDMLDNERDGKPTNFLVLFYLGAAGGKTGDTGRRTPRGGAGQGTHGRRPTALWRWHAPREGPVERCRLSQRTKRGTVRTKLPRSVEDDRLTDGSENQTVGAECGKERVSPSTHVADQGAKTAGQSTCHRRDRNTWGVRLARGGGRRRFSRHR